MNKQEFLNTLRIIFKKANVLDVESIIDVYEEHFAVGYEKGLNDEQIIKSLGTPKEIYTSYVEAGIITDEIADTALAMLEIDKMGLDHIDRNILLTMINKFGGGPVGLETLAAAVSEETDTIGDVYEPYLLQLGFINRTPRGRVVTKLGYEHLGLTKTE